MQLPIRLRTSLLALGLCAACGSETTALHVDGADQWDLLVVVLDALPANHLSIYGYVPPGSTGANRNISPNLTALASGNLNDLIGAHQTTIFEDAYSSASYTLASTASLFTGANPATHGVLGHGTNVLAEQHLTLAEALQGAGFATCALTSNPNVSSEGQFDQGFDLFRHYFRDDFDQHVIPENFIADAGAWWQHESGQQRFLYAHMLPPHQPYTSPAPHSTLYGAEAIPRVEVLTPALVTLGERRDLTPSSPEVMRIERRFNTGVHYADALVADLFKSLAGPDGHGLDKTLIVVTSDHGEAFAQHGLLLHGGGVNEELCHVPLIISTPGSDFEGRRSPHLVSTTNLAPSLCEVLDVAWPGAAKGTSFASALLNSESTEEPALSRSAGDQPIWGIRLGDYFLVEHRATKSVRLFNRKDDPAELKDIAADRPKIVKQLTNLLRTRLEQARQAGLAFPSGNTPKLLHKDALEALGYFD